jgi:hypothetical protein
VVTTPLAFTRLFIYDTANLTSVISPFAASHVTMSVVKLLSRIVAPSENELANSGASTLHDHTYGITSDPIIQFACVLYVKIMKD